MIRSSVSTLSTHWKLAVLLYGVSLILAFVLAVPLFSTLARLTAASGYAHELAQTFDLMLWADILQKGGSAVLGNLAQVFWIVPVVIVWNAASGVGLIHAMHQDAEGGFWSGVGRYTGRALVLAFCFAVPLLLVGILIMLTSALLGLIWSGEVGLFRVIALILPGGLILLAILLDCMQDFARIALVCDNAPPLEAWKTGVTWIFRRRRALRVYLFWFVVSATLMALPVLLDTAWGAASTGALLVLFLVQQVFLLARQAVRIAWIGSEMKLFLNAE